MGKKRFNGVDGWMICFGVDGGSRVYWAGPDKLLEEAAARKDILRIYICTAQNGEPYKLPPALYPAAVLFFCDWCSFCALGAVATG